MILTFENTSIYEVNTTLLDMVDARQACDNERDNDHCIYANLGCQFCGYSIVYPLNSSLENFQHQVTGGSPYDDIYFSDWKQNNHTVSVYAMSKSEWPNAYDFGMELRNIG